MFNMRLLISQPLRFSLTVGGISLCIVLILFLLGIYRGVYIGSVEYIRQNNCDLWVLQGGTSNILRGTSILSTAHGYVIRNNEYIKEAAPVLLLLSTLRSGDHNATIFLTGYDTEKMYGGPPQIQIGENIKQEDEIVLDISFAKKYKITINDTVFIQDNPFRVTGLSAGTNAFVIQYGFITLKQAQRIIGFPNLITCYLLQIKNGIHPRDVVRALEQDLPGIAVYAHDEFLHNNIKEMESGILPLFYAIAAISLLVLTVILSLILSMNIIEHRRDFAVLKTLGAPAQFLPALIIKQGFIICMSAAVIALLIFFPLMELIEEIAPEISVRITLSVVAFVLMLILITSLISSFFSIRRLQRIYPLEAFA